MADNTQLNAGSGGDLFRTLDDGAVKWPVGVTAFATTVGDPDVLQLVTPAAGLPVHQQTGATWAVTGPLTDAQLRAAAVSVSLAEVPIHAVTQSGAWAVGLSAAQTLATVTALTGGGVAHDGADSGNPHKIGARATTSLAGLTLVASADRTDLLAGVDGVLITRPHCNLEDIVTAAPVVITDGSSTAVLPAQGAGVKVYVTEVSIANTSGSNLTVDLREGNSGAVKWTFPVPANGGVVKTFATPLPFGANTAVAADPSAAASSVTVSVLGFKSKV